VRLQTALVLQAIQMPKTKYYSAAVPYKTSSLTRRSAKAAQLIYIPTGSQVG
jgi:hypothetical protein